MDGYRPEAADDHLITVERVDVRSGDFYSGSRMTKHAKQDSKMGR